jgi:hypothetical protein
MRDECATLERELTALTAERDELRAENERLKKQAVFDADHVHALNLGFATRAEVERVRSDRDCEKRLRKDAEEFRENAIERAEKAEADLAAAKERLRSEAMDDYASIKDLQRELAAERARLDWVFRNCKVTADDFTTGNRDVYAIHDREDLGAAMKEDAK